MRRVRGLSRSGDESQFIYRSLVQFYFLHPRPVLERLLIYAGSFSIVLVKSIVRIEQSSRLRQIHDSLFES